jgi:molecular chaperone Hsp33
VLANPGGIKAAGGIIAQVLPGATDHTIDVIEQRAREMAPVTTQIAAGASVEDLARALAGDLELRFTRSYDLAFTCTCSRDRVERVLLGLGEDELRKIASEQPQTEAVCEFCKTAYVLSRDEVLGLIDRLEARR